MSVYQAAVGCPEINADTIDNFPPALVAGQRVYFSCAESQHPCGNLQRVAIH